MTIKEFNYWTGFCEEGMDIFDKESVFSHMMAFINEYDQLEKFENAKNPHMAILFSFSDKVLIYKKCMNFFRAFGNKLNLGIIEGIIHQW